MPLIFLLLTRLLTSDPLLQSQETSTLQTASMTTEHDRLMSQEEYQEEYQEYLENEPEPLSPHSIDEIEPSVRVINNANGPSPKIVNDVGTSADTIESYLSYTTTRIIFITHGYTGSIEEPWMDETANAILTISSDQVIVLVGWKKGAARWTPKLYWQAVANTQVVGKFIGDIAAEVKARRPEVEIYGIGHSLGSHVMGAAGRHSGSFSRITGLDPAGPAFESDNLDKRLSATDATFVDVIHTDGSPSGSSFVPDHYGTLIPLGDLDFYPNWGKRGQPGCIRMSEYRTGCSHHKSVDYFIWSITHKGKFLAREEILKEPKWYEIDRDVRNITREDEMPEMGYYADTRRIQTGYYYIKTNANPPYV